MSASLSSPLVSFGLFVVMCLARMSRIDQVRCNPSAVAVRLCAGLAGAKFALFSGRSAAAGTMDGKYLFWSEFFSHDRKIMTLTDIPGMVNCDQPQINVCAYP